MKSRICSLGSQFEYKLHPDLQNSWFSKDLIVYFLGKQMNNIWHEFLIEHGCIGAAIYFYGRLYFMEQNIFV